MKHPLRLAIIIAAALLVIGASIYGYFSYTNWQDLDKHSQAVSANFKASIDSSLAAESPTATPAEQIDQLVADFDKENGENPCTVASLYNWQTVLPAVQTIKQDCRQRVADAVAVVKTLKPLSSFLEQQTAASTAITTTITQTKPSTDYEANAAAWRTLADNSLFSTDNEFKNVALKAKEAILGVSGAYTALSAAVKAEDKSAFDSAVTALTNAYTALSGIGETAKIDQQALVTSIIEAYKKL